MSLILAFSSGSIRNGERAVKKFFCLFRIGFLLAVSALVLAKSSFLTPSEPAQEKPSITLTNTSYPIPLGALFVSTSGSDTNRGTETAPWRTIKKAVESAPSGSTIVIRGGIYRESIQHVDKRLTFQPYRHEKVWMKGSAVVTDWVKDGVIWRKDNWTYKFVPTSDTNAIDPAYPMAKYPDQAFIDGKPSKQVVTKAEVVPGTFFVDYATNQLFIGDNPAGRTVEASVHVFAINFQFGSDGSTVRGLGFMHYAPNYSLEKGPAMVVGNAQRLTFENNIFAYSANRGLSVFGMDAVIRGNILTQNGAGGLSGYKSHRTIIEGNYIGYNNTEHFKAGWDANGAKFANSSSLVWRDNIVEYNLGGGLWCDYQCRDNVFVRNIVRYNGLHNGLFYEISQGGIIASNLIYGNEGTGISLSQSNGVKIYNNTLSKNGVNIVANNCSSTNIIKNNILSNISDTLRGDYASLYTDCSNTPGDVIVSQLDHNAYYRTSSAPPQQGLIVWAGHGRYNDLASFQKARSKELSGLAIDDQATNPFFIDEANGNYHLKANSPAKGKGEPLPKDVATAIGVSSGVPVDMGALIWPESSDAPVMQRPKKP